MASEIIINVAPEETRVAVLDRKILTDLYIDRVKQRDFVGNVYKGKIVKVLPGLQAAFVDIGQEKAAFMHVSELVGEAGKLDFDAIPGFANTVIYFQPVYPVCIDSYRLCCCTG